MTKANGSIPPEYDFGIRLKELRERSHMTQKDVADRLGVHKNTVSNYENNILTPSVDVLIKLALLFNTSTDYILGLDKRNSVALSGSKPEHQDIILHVMEILKQDLDKLK